MIDQILAYIATNPRHRVTVGFKLPDGKIVRVNRKLQGDDQQGITNAIAAVKARGAKEIAVEIYRPNGSAEVVSKTFIIEVDKTTDIRPATLMGPPTLFDSQPVVSRSHKPQPIKQMEPQSWKDYALKTELDKVKKLEDELLKVKTKNEELDGKVREFEKTMLQKDFEIEKLTQRAEGKTGLNGFIDKASESPAMMGTLANIIAKWAGAPPALGQQQLASGSPELEGTKPEQYVANIKAWLFKQPEAIQDKFYELVYQITNLKDVPAALEKLLNLIVAGTSIKKPMPSTQEDEIHIGM